MNAQIWCYDFKLFIMIWKFDIGTILLNKFHSFTGYHCISLLIAPQDISCFLSLAIVCSNWRMVRNLFWEKFKIIVNEFIGFSQKWIERLSIRSFDTSVLSRRIYCNHGKSPWWVFIFYQCSMINNIWVLHRYCTLLKQTKWSIKKYWHSKFWYIFSNWISYHCPNAYFQFWIFEPGKLWSFFWLIQILIIRNL